MTAPASTVCSPWCEITDLPSPCRENAYNFDSDVIDDALLSASEVLYHLTFQQWPGACSERLRPCAQYRHYDTMRTNMRPGLTGAYSTLTGTYSSTTGSLLGWSGSGWSCSCRDVHQCGCHWLSQIELGMGPIVSVDEIRLDGEILDPARYRVDDYRWLVYIPESDSAERQGWPCCQRLDRPTTAVDTFEVDATIGAVPSRAGVRAAASLACQFMLAWSPSGAGECKLPKRVTSMSRQQVTMNLSDPVQLFDKGLTGVAEVDLWVQAIRSERTQRHGAVVIPERQRAKSRRVDT